MRGPALQEDTEFGDAKNCFSDNCPMRINYNKTGQSAKVIIITIIKDCFALKRKKKKGSLTFSLRMRD